MSLPEQPHDIVALPYMPAAPGFVEWVMFVTFAAALGVVVWWLRRPERALREPRAVREQVLHAINNVRTVLEDQPLRPAFVKQLLLEVSVLSRRAIHGVNASGETLLPRLETLTRAELSEILSQPLTGETRQFISALVLLERYKYCPEEVLRADAPRLRDQVQELGEAAKVYFSQVSGGSPRP